MEKFNILEKSEEFQRTIAESVKDPVMLAVLAQSPSNSVRITAVTNPCIKTETLKEKLNDEDEMVRWNVKRTLERRGINI